MKQTTSEVLSTDSYNNSGYTTVFTGTIGNSMAEGWQTVVLNTPFTYYNSENLEIAVVHNNQPCTGQGPQWKYFTREDEKILSRSANSDVCLPSTLYATSGRPALQLSFLSTTSSGTGSNTVMLRAEHDFGTKYLSESDDEYRGVILSSRTGNQRYLPRDMRHGAYSNKLHIARELSKFNLHEYDEALSKAGSVDETESRVGIVCTFEFPKITHALANLDGGFIDNIKGYNAGTWGVANIDEGESSGKIYGGNFNLNFNNTSVQKGSGYVPEFVGLRAELSGTCQPSHIQVDFGNLVDPRTGEQDDSEELASPLISQGKRI